uniref:DNA-directed RNA polymerase n=1 Tax=Aphanochaete elegans TaxID=764105 RepID=A0A6H1XDM1_9CHLO|nr:beta subunit of RNA polymerase [Aphanochaete elegans]QJA13746.1 beta subunit of RNA polymerase [Aphanochaete elegans]
MAYRFEAIAFLNIYIFIMFNSKSLKIIPIEYSLQTFHRSNQDTSLLQRPVVYEGDWVQAGDLLADCSSSKGGEFSIGRNILIAYLPWEGYNYEDAILISERLVYDELYTSIHIERYEISIETTPYGEEKITKDIPQLKDTKELEHLDDNGIALLGTWLKEGNILVGKITPTEPKKNVAPYIQLYNDIMGKKIDYSVRDSSLRMPRGLEAKLIKVKIFKQKPETQLTKDLSEKNAVNFLPISNCLKKIQLKTRSLNFLYSNDSEYNLFSKLKQINDSNLINDEKKSLIKYNKVKAFSFFGKNNSLTSSIDQVKNLKKSKKLTQNISAVHIYLAEKRKVQVGDKMAGRHGNKGIISEILPRQDMPYLPDGTTIDMALNPLGVPSRMNVGQIYECLLGLAGKQLQEQYRILPFDELYGPEASRSFVFSKLYEAKIKTGKSWLFQPTNPGKLKLFDGRDGSCFDQSITTGYSYMIKLVHLVDDKIHCLTKDHDVLTTEGWIPINKIKMTHKIASLNKNGFLIYQNPHKIYHYKNFKGKLYKLKNSNIDLLVTLNHQMYVTNYRLSGSFFENYELLQVKNIIGKPKKYLKTARWEKKEYQFNLPSILSNSKWIPGKKLNMTRWLQFFGIWFSQGWVTDKNLQIADSFCIKIRQKNNLVTKYLTQIIQDFGYPYRISNYLITIKDEQLWTYLKPFSEVSTKKHFPAWIWELNRKQAQILLKSLCVTELQLFKNSLNYYTSSSQIANELMRLALHAGWSGHKYLYHYDNNRKSKILTTNNIWCINFTKIFNTPSINENFNLLNRKPEQIIFYQGSVFCLHIPNNVFYIRRNGIPVWTGNSRSTGPYSLVTQQPLKGRSKYGGQRLGEMEVWALEAYGAAFTLLELLTIKSDDVTGRLTIWDYVLYKRPLYIGTPASFKVLICELESLCLDIGIFKKDKLGLLRSITVSNMG